MMGRAFAHIALCVGAAAGASVVSLSAYPGYGGNLSVTGTLRVSTSGAGIALEGALGGLEAAVTGGIHVHSCTLVCRRIWCVATFFIDKLAPVRVVLHDRDHGTLI